MKRCLVILMLALPSFGYSRLFNCFVALTRANNELPTFNAEDLLGADIVKSIRERFPNRQIVVSLEHGNTHFEKGFLESLGIPVSEAQTATDNYSIRLEPPPGGSSEDRAIDIVNFDLITQKNAKVIVENLELGNPLADPKKSLKANQELPGFGLEVAKRVFSFIKEQKPGAHFIACPDTYAGMRGYQIFGKFQPIGDKGARVVDRLEQVYKILKKQKLDSTLAPKNLDEYSKILAKSLELTPEFVNEEWKKFQRSGQYDASKILPIKNDKGEVIGVIAKPGTYRSQVFINTAPEGSPTDFVSWHNMIYGADSWQLLLEN